MQAVIVRFGVRMSSFSLRAEGASADLRSFLGADGFFSLRGFWFGNEALKFFSHEGTKLRKHEKKTGISEGSGGVLNPITDTAYPARAVHTRPRG